MSGVVKKPQSLEKLLINVKSVDGKESKKLAFSKEWCENREWMHFSPVDGTDDWFEAVSEFEDDLIWLLSLPHNKFWSQLVFDPGARTALVSYLQKAPRSFDSDLLGLAPTQKEILTRVHNLVFKIYNRLMTSKESDTCFLSKEMHGTIMYENYLLDVPAMLDLCLLFGVTERRNLSKLLQSVIKSQPKYASDLQSTAQMFVKALKDLEQYFVGEAAAGNSEPVKLSNLCPSERGLIKEQQLEDYILFLIDIVSSTSMLLEILPSLLPSFVSALPEIEISQFYEQTLPTMYNSISQVEIEDRGSSFNTMMNCARVSLLSVAKLTLNHRANSIISEHEFTRAMGQTEEYLTVLSECLSCPKFIMDLHSVCPLDCDLKRLLEARPDILDESKCNYLTDSIFSCLESCSVERRNRKSPSASEPSSSMSNSSKEPTPAPSTSNTHIRTDEVMSEDILLESLICSIQDMLPDLGAGFLKKCLKHYNMDKEAVVNAVLEDSLPPGLKELDRTLPLLPTEIMESNNLPTLTPRLNVFDHDEFDIMSRNYIDTSRVHQGKRKSKHKNLSQLLDDKKDLAQIKDTYTSYGTVSDVVYDDEYDDTYDELKEFKIDDGADPDAERRPFVTPRVLRKKVEVVEEEEEESEEETEENIPNRDNFAQDPALMRERAQQRREAKYGPPRQAPRGDVVGNAKGKGQDANVLLNRRRKDANKSSRGNHNRRAGAERKLRQGMIPS
ncbi:activating signal cointegrator 1 complex subunit 2 [Neocloeon triangulifer]|uniref:activating signal cointegrator 1 complex subunit 2 n=1 Tax=Neocloeon triangulifer TaxID=2078957 RepID=UPI00286ED79E|nr:activating signal cointegrator 1 complex subunit 2 [Neocloeon triangulifer]